jgi:anion-transporting  ArsA/GET3 family ATPase
MPAPPSRRIKVHLTPQAHLAEMLREKKVLLCVGSGGVGKTTTSAALALAAARAGKRVICLTIDPAKRLANSLGLEEMTLEETQVEPEIFARAGVEVPGSLTVMMLDTKRTFDEIVRRHASSDKARDTILQNRIYQYVSTSLAGTQEYMAMEKLQSLRDAGQYDLIVLDTPPTANALDFLDAPERMVEAIDSPAMRWFVQAFTGSKGGGGGKVVLGLLGKGSQLVLKAVSKMIGTAFLDQLAGFIAAINDLFGGFTERAKRVSEALRGPDVAFVLVTSPEPMAIEEINFFADRLRTFAMPRDVFVVNRVHVAPGERPSAEQIAKALEASSLPSDAEFVSAVATAHEESRVLSARDHHHLRALHLEDGGAAAPVVHVPAFESDVHDVGTLARVAEALVGLPT